MSVTKISSDNILSMSSAKLTGAMPAMDGSALTGIVAGSEAMTGSSDPVNETNPADGVGALWINTTTGEMFICVDAATDGNVWNNVGEGSGDVTYTSWSYQGTSYGYAVGGYTAGPTTRYNVINRHSFSTFGSNATDVGDLGFFTSACNGASSIDYGWRYAGGHNLSGGAFTWFPNIEKFSFASATTDAVNHAELYNSLAASTSANSETYAYTLGGQDTTLLPYTTSKAQKFPFASTTNSTFVGNMTFTDGLYHQAGWSSSTHGYSAGGYDYGAATTIVGIVEKFSFATDGNGISISSLSTARSYVSGTNSTTHGYIHGGFGVGWPVLASIDKYNFSSETESTGIGNLTTTLRDNTGQSSTTHGYSSGGDNVDTIQRYSFINDGISVDGGGNLTVALREGASGIQI
tara:strand:+ start:165 stop:1382 length:1218 start_codon:yes stop_codon:yes gene_type:complete